MTISVRQLITEATNLGCLWVRNEIKSVTTGSETSSSIKIIKSSTVLLLVPAFMALSPFSMALTVISGRNFLPIEASQHSKYAVKQEMAASWATALDSTVKFLTESK